MSRLCACGYRPRDQEQPAVVAPHQASTALASRSLIYRIKSSSDSPAGRPVPDVDLDGIGLAALSDAAAGRSVPKIICIGAGDRDHSRTTPHRSPGA